MQDMMTANSSTAQQSVIQGVNQAGPSNTHPLLYTTTIYSQDMSQQNQQQQMMSMHQNRQQQSNEPVQMITDLNPFMTGDMNMNQQSQEEQMMSQSTNTDEKEAYKSKFSRGYRQLP
jgi:hypothetical protein